eukprot:jgi/Chrpa1/16963/Chrysochromulina_OHIO_Genome00004793-RA
MWCCAQAGRVSPLPENAAVPPEASAQKLAPKNAALPPEASAEKPASVIRPQDTSTLPIATGNFPSVEVHRRAMDVYTKLDLNADNKLVLAELAAFVGEGAAARFKQLDIDEDGKITRTEFSDAFGRIERELGQSAAISELDEMLQRVDAYNASSEGVAAELSSKGFSLGQLLDFVQEKCHEQKLISETTTTLEVVRNIVIPETQAAGCCYADTLPGGPRTPQTLMSHWWGNTFLHLVRAICEHAAGKNELFPHMYTQAERAKTYWLCIFAVNQHAAACHFMGCSCGCPKFGSGDVKCQVDKFPRVMRRMSSHGLAMDLQLRTLTRVWVLSELETAMHSSPPLATKFCGVVSTEILERPEVPSVLQAEASFEADRELILTAIASNEGGVAQFDRLIQTMALREIALMRAFAFVLRGEAALLGEELQQRPELLDSADSKGRGETLLMRAARYGHVPVVRELLARGADVGLATRGMGFTALHYGAICFNPGAHADVLELLLQARAEPGALNCFGRTALEESVLALGEEAHGTQLLLGATPDAQQAVARAHAATGFTPQPDDAELFAHWGLRQDSWSEPGIVLALKQPIDGEIAAFNPWVKPIEFGTAANELVPNYPEARTLVTASQRFAAYIRYRWPLWEFTSLVLQYTGSDPAFYRVDLEWGELRQINRGDEKLTIGQQIYDENSVLTKVQCSIRMLYP